MLEKHPIISALAAAALIAAPTIAVAQNNAATHNNSGTNYGSNGTINGATGNTATANSANDNRLPGFNNDRGPHLFGNRNLRNGETTENRNNKRLTGKTLRTLRPAT